MYKNDLKTSFEIKVNMGIVKIKKEVCKYSEIISISNHLNRISKEQTNKNAVVKTNNCYFNLTGQPIKQSFWI